MMKLHVRCFAACLLGGLILGCNSSPDPYARLAIGSAALLYEKDSEYVMVKVGGKNELLPTGTHVTIASDEEETSRGEKWRIVRLLVESGDFKGKAGTTIRQNLRAVPGQSQSSP